MHGIVFFLSFLPLSSFLPVIWQVLAKFWTQFSSLSFRPRHKVSSLPPSLLPFLPSLPPSFPHSFPSLFLRFFVRFFLPSFLPFLFLFLPSPSSVLLILIINDKKIFLILTITAAFLDPNALHLLTSLRNVIAVDYREGQGENRSECLPVICHRTNSKLIECSLGHC